MSDSNNFNNIDFIIEFLFSNGLPLKNIMYIKYDTFDWVIGIWQLFASKASMDIIPYAKP